MRHILSILIVCCLPLVGIKAQSIASVDNSRIEYEDRYHNLDELPKIKYHLWPKVTGKTDVLGFFDAIVDSYYIDLWTIAALNLHPEDAEEIGEAVASKKVLDRKKGYLRVEFRREQGGVDFVECTYWNKKDGTKLVALNFDYDHLIDDQFYTKGKAHDILFYEYQSATRLLKPIAPPVDGNIDLKGVALPREGRDLVLPGGRRLKWRDGWFSADDKPAVTVKGTASVPEISPSLIGQTFDFSEQAIKKFKEEDDGMYSDIYDIVGGGCSFYCGCSIGEQRASSTLKSQGRYDYKAGNAHDLSYATAWVEGAAGDGVGEWIEYTLPAYNPRITDICVANGLVRTKKAWTENSRVEALEVSVNGKKHCMLYLKDVYAPQWFEVPTIGYDDRDHLDGKAPIVIRFTIRAVYPGTKYKDTAISEIYFSGIDVH